MTSHIRLFHNLVEWDLYSLRTEQVITHSNGLLCFRLEAVLSLLEMNSHLNA